MDDDSRYCTALEAAWQVLELYGWQGRNDMPMRLSRITYTILAVLARRDGSDGKADGNGGPGFGPEVTHG